MLLIPVVKLYFPTQLHRARHCHSRNASACHTSLFPSFSQQPLHQTHVSSTIAPPTPTCTVASLARFALSSSTCHAPHHTSLSTRAAVSTAQLVYPALGTTPNPAPSPHTPATRAAVAQLVCRPMPHPHPSLTLNTAALSPQLALRLSLRPRSHHLQSLPTAKCVILLCHNHDRCNCAIHLFTSTSFTHSPPCTFSSLHSFTQLLVHHCALAALPSHSSLLPHRVPVASNYIAAVLAHAACTAPHL